MYVHEFMCQFGRMERVHSCYGMLRGFFYVLITLFHRWYILIPSVSFVCNLPVESLYMK